MSKNSHVLVWIDNEFEKFVTINFYASHSMYIQRYCMHNLCLNVHIWPSLFCDLNLRPFISPNAKSLKSVASRTEGETDGRTDGQIHVLTICNDFWNSCTGVWDRDIKSSCFISIFFNHKNNIWYNVPCS